MMRKIRNKGLATVLMLALALSANAKEQVLSVNVNDVDLSVTLLTAKRAKAAAIIIAGSGPTDRDGNSAMLPGKNNSLKYLAEALAKKGVTTLRYDKRMIGASASTAFVEADLRFDHFVDDAAALSDWLSERTGLPTILIGHSEGGQIALNAAQNAKIAGVAVLAGPGRHPADILLDQLAAQLPPALLERSEEIIAEMRKGNTVTDTPVVLASLFRSSVQPYMISWFANDPSAQAAALEVPLLLVYGTRDVQVEASEGDVLSDAQSDATLVVVDGMNHVLKNIGDDESLQNTSYSDPSLPIDKTLVKSIADFVSRIVR